MPLFTNELPKTVAELDYEIPGHALFIDGSQPLVVAVPLRVLVDAMLAARSPELELTWDSVEKRYREECVRDVCGVLAGLAAVVEEGEG